MAENDLVVSNVLRIPRAEIDVRFTTSGGPGGQHANKVATRVELRFDVSTSAALSEYQRSRVIQKYGELMQVSVDDTRSQARNRSLAEQRLIDQLASALVATKRRRPTRRTRGANERRLKAKGRRAELKANRRKPPPDA